jgi:hypothetical protein
MYVQMNILASTAPYNPPNHWFRLIFSHLSDSAFFFWLRYAFFFTFSWFHRLFLILPSFSDSAFFFFFFWFLLFFWFRLFIWFIFLIYFSSDSAYLSDLFFRFSSKLQERIGAAEPAAGAVPPAEAVWNRTGEDDRAARHWLDVHESEEGWHAGKHVLPSCTSRHWLDVQ